MSDFEFVGRYQIYNIDFTVVDANGTVVDADAPPMAFFKRYDDDTTLWSRTTTNVGTGIYRLTLSSVETAAPGLFYVLWTYTLSAVAQQYRTNIEISASESPIYPALSDDAKLVADHVWAKFADMFDSALGGPHLQMYAQSTFGRETVASLIGSALGRLNTTAQPYTTFGLFPPAPAFPYASWGPLLEQATVIEVIKHLMRSYVEQPSPENIQQARLDRRDYLTRWQTILDIEQQALDDQLPFWRIAMLQMGYIAVIVDGGAYGRSPYIGTVPGRPRRPLPPVR